MGRFRFNKNYVLFASKTSLVEMESHFGCKNTHDILNSQGVRNFVERGTQYRQIVSQSINALLKIERVFSEEDTVKALNILNAIIHKARNIQKLKSNFPEMRSMYGKLMQSLKTTKGSVKKALDEINICSQTIDFIEENKAQYE